LAHTTTHQPPAAPLHRSHLIPPLRHLFLRARRNAAKRPRPVPFSYPGVNPQTAPLHPPPDPRARHPAYHLHQPPLALADLPRGKPPHLRLPPRLCYPPPRNAAKPPTPCSTASWPATTQHQPATPTTARARRVLLPRRAPAVPPPPCPANFPTSRQVEKLASRHTPPTTKDGGAPAYRGEFITPPPAARSSYPGVNLTRPNVPPPCSRHRQQGSPRLIVPVHHTPPSLLHHPPPSTTREEAPNAAKPPTAAPRFLACDHPAPTTPTTTACARRCPCRR